MNLEVSYVRILTFNILIFYIGICFCFVHCEATLLFLRLRFEIYNYLLNSILWKILCGTMDKSKICVIFKYEVRCGTNILEAARKINIVLLSQPI